MPGPIASFRTAGKRTADFITGEYTDNEHDNKQFNEREAGTLPAIIGQAPA